MNEVRPATRLQPTPRRQSNVRQRLDRSRPVAYNEPMIAEALGRALLGRARQLLIVATGAFSVGCGPSITAPQTATPVDSSADTTSAETTSTETTAASDPEQIRFVFDWPDGLRAHVTARRAISRQHEEVFDVTSSWEMASSSNGANVQVRTSDYEVPAIAYPLEEDTINGALVFQMLLPSMSIGSDGALLSADVSQARRQIEAALESAVAPEVRAHPSWQLTTTLLAPAVLEASFRNTWLALGEGLAGNEMRLGEPLEARAEVVLPTSGEMAEMQNRYTAVGRVPCVSGQQALDCVALEIDATVSPETLTAMTNGVQGDIQLRELRFHTALVSQPETLVPYSMTVTKVTHYELHGRPVVEEEVRTWTFAYENDPSR